MIGVDNTTRRSEGPPAGCATATAKIFGSRSLAGRWDRVPTLVAQGNAAGRLPGGKPDEGELHVRFGKGEQETGPMSPRLLPTSQSEPGKARAHGEGVQRVHAREGLQGTETLVNTGEPWPDPYGAEQRVRRMQTKLHHWAADDPGRRFDDLFNLVYHPDFLTVAWERVRSNKGGRTPGWTG